MIAIANVAVGHWLVVRSQAAVHHGHARSDAAGSARRTPTERRCPRSGVQVASVTTLNSRGLAVSRAAHQDERASPTVPVASDHVP